MAWHRDIRRILLISFTIYSRTHTLTRIASTITQPHAFERNLTALVNAESLVASRAAHIHLHNHIQISHTPNFVLTYRISSSQPALNYQLGLITFRMSGRRTVRDNFMRFVANERGWVDVIVQDRRPCNNVQIE